MKIKITTTISLFALIFQCVIAQNQEVQKRPAPQEGWKEEARQPVIQESRNVTFTPAPKIHFVEMSQPQDKCQELAYKNTLTRVINEVSMDSETKRELGRLSREGGHFTYNNRTYRYPLHANYTQSYYKSLEVCKSQAVQKPSSSAQTGTQTRTNTYSSGSGNTTQDAYREMGQAIGEAGSTIALALIEANREKKAEEARIRAELARIRAEEARAEEARRLALGQQTREGLIGSSEYNSESKLIAYNNASNNTTSGLRQMPTNNKGNEIKWIGSTGIEYSPDGEIVRTHAQDLYYTLPVVKSSFSGRNYVFDHEVSKKMIPKNQLTSKEKKQEAIDLFDKIKNSDVVKSFDGIGETFLEDTGLGSLGNALSGMSAVKSIKDGSGNVINELNSLASSLGGDGSTDIVSNLLNNITARIMADIRDMAKDYSPEKIRKFLRQKENRQEIDDATKKVINKKTTNRN